MSGWQHRVGSAASLNGANRIYALGELIVESDNENTGTPLKYKWGDGIQTYSELPYAGLGGGSSTPPALTDLGTLGATVTLPTPGEGDLQAGVLSANLLITPMTQPPTGQTRTSKLKLTQNGTGGWTWGIATSAKFPAGIQIPLTAPGAENWMEWVWDGDTSSYAIFPATAGATVVTCTALDVLGGDGGRFLGFQHSGIAPTEASPSTNDFWIDTSGTPSFWIWSGSAWENFGGVSGGGGGVSITSPNSSVVVAGSTSAPQLEVAASYLSIPSPAGFARASYSAATSQWLAASDRFADVIEHFGVTPGVTADQSVALNNAIETLGKAGYIGFLPPSAGVPVQVKTNPLQIGDGSSTAAATWTGGLVGGMPVTNSNSDYTLVGSSQILWTGSSGGPALVELNGPLQGWQLENIVLDGGASAVGTGPLWCLVDSSGHYGLVDHMIFRGCQGGIQVTTCGATGGSVGGAASNCSNENYGQISVQFWGSGSSTTPQTAFAALMFTEGSGSNGNGNSCYNVINDLTVSYSGSSANYSYGVIFSACDSNKIKNLHVGYNASKATKAPIAYIYLGSGRNQWPSDCCVDLLEAGGHPTGYVEVGTPATTGIGRNRIERVSMVNGFTPDPLGINTSWGSPNMHGVATLVNGHASIAIPSALHSVGMIVKTSVQTFGGTPGLVQGSIPSNSTVAINSYESDGVTVQTLDTSKVYWEMVAG